MLEIKNLSLAYGLHRALDNVALDVARGEIVTILGANGAGKTSLLKAIAGVVRTLPGKQVRLGGRDIASLPPHDIVECGLALVPEGRGIFGELTVKENLLLGANPKRARHGEAARRDQVFSLFPRLRERAGQIARTMSGGEQQMLAIGRALMSNPDILLLDEPSLGLSPAMVHELFATLRRVREAGVGLLLVEQNAQESLAIADRGYVLENGVITGHGSAAHLKSDPAVQRAYLGGPPPADTQSRHATSKEEAMHEITLLLESKDVPASNGATFDRLNPVTGDIASRAAAAQIADAKRAADTAAAAFPAWSATGPNARRAILLKAADLLAAKAPQFIELMAAETGATAGWAGFNVHLAAGMLREAASMTTQISGEVIPSDKPGCIAMAIRSPAGVVLSMAPWNAPVILGVRAVALPLACGNTVVLKASEICPGTHRLIAECLRDAGLPPGVLNVITNAPEDAPALIEMLIGHPAVRRVNFTGSTRVGRIIAQVAAKYLKPALLELGGKAPMIVLDDADIDAAVAAAAFGAFMNQGQICMSTERLVVDEKVADAFVTKLAAKAGSLVAGDPRKGNTPLGSLIGADAAVRIQALINDAVSKGAKVVAGGRSEGTLMSATVIDGVNSSMRIYNEESFGPVVSVVRVNGADEAVRVANDTEYGLSAAVFGRDIARALEIAKRIDSGICHVNGPTVHDEAQMPFGGVKASGYGRFGGKAGIAEFTELRWITIETGPQHYPI
jgi:acyl-CoA reductase-like NAD-dependent aldehyde dehydrogenase/ABC-type branched-subunit amino acid transport system ATPase component